MRVWVSSEREQAQLDVAAQTVGFTAILVARNHCVHRSPPLATNTVRPIGVVRGSPYASAATPACIEPSTRRPRTG